MKRLFDILVAMAALLFLAAPFLVIIIILRFTGEGNIWYRQERVGYQGKHFKVFKFCTMRVGSEFIGNKDITVRDDPRVLPVGHILRITKLNELPQVLNILFGDMSVVGWRPLVPRGFGDYSEYVKRNIVKQKPGITGVGSIVFRDEEAIITEAGKNGQDLVATYRDDILPFKGKVELWYNQNHNMLIDLQIIFLTTYAILSPGNDLVFKWFKGLPRPESELIKKHSGYNKNKSEAVRS